MSAPPFTPAAEMGFATGARALAMPGFAPGCTGKSPYASRRMADRAIGHIVARRKFRHDPSFRLNAYRCDCCGYWHIGNRNI